jgi:hypothetical protein
MFLLLDKHEKKYNKAPLYSRDFHPSNFADTPLIVLAFLK